MRAEVGYCETCNKLITKPRTSCNHCYSIKRRFGIDPKYIMELRVAQGFRCKICKKYCATNRALAIDHDHLTGKIRGLLCMRCNMGIGYFESPDLLNEAADYLRLPPLDLPYQPVYEFQRMDRVTYEASTIALRIYLDTSIPAMRAKARILAKELEITNEAAMSRLRRLHRNRIKRLHPSD